MGFQGLFASSVLGSSAGFGRDLVRRCFPAGGGANAVTGSYARGERDGGGGDTFLLVADDVSLILPFEVPLGAWNP